MSDELYFLPILAEAFSTPGTKTSLKQAFDQIQRLGSQPRYQCGHKNFTWFMAEACCHHKILNEDHLRQLMLDIALATGKFSTPQKKVGMKMIASSTLHQKEFDEISEMIGHSTDQARCLVINVFCNRKKMGTLELPRQASRQSISGIVPGAYILKLDTGWVLWQEPLTEKDLLWKKAFDAKDLKLAADSGQTSPDPVRRIPLLDGRIVIVVFAGIESGMIELQLRDVNGNG